MSYDGMEILEEVETHFNKKFEFSKPACGWELNANTQFWSSEEWTEPSQFALKTELNDVKNLLNDKDRAKWCNHTQLTNPAGNIVPQLRRRIHPELCTQAWAKFFEILSNFRDLTTVPSHIGLKSVHLCEAPGAFIAALNHFLSLHHCQQKRKWHWIGTTLNPYYEGNSRTCMIADDRFILNTSEHWNFGLDNTGDIMNLQNLEYLCISAYKIGPIHLVSADGSINCAADPAEQENSVSWLHYCEVVTAFQMLAPGGNFVIKMFTFFEHLAISLMYLLNCAFRQVFVFKPGTSKAGNSEVYVICLDFIKAQMSGYLGQLKQALGNPALHRALLDRSSIPVEFLEQLFNCSKYFKTHQAKIIQRNIELYEDFRTDKRHYMDQLKRKCVEYYLDDFCLKRIPDTQCIMRRAKTKKPAVLTKDLIRYTQQGSFNDGKQKEHLSFLEKLDYIEQDLNALLSDSWSPGQHPEQTFVNETVGDFTWVEKQKFVWGKPITAVQSTRFCYQYMWNLWNDVARDFKGTKSVWLKDDLRSFIQEYVSESSNTWIADISPLQEDLASFTEHYQILNYNTQTCLTTTASPAVDKSNWVLALMCVVKTLRSGDKLVLIAGDIVTRFQAGCFFILTQLFSTATIVRPNIVPPFDPRVVILCSDFHQPAVLVVNFLEQTFCELAKESPNIALLEILPVSFLVESEGYSCLYKFNEAKVGCQIYSFIAKEREKSSR